jgi:fibronectin type 3 domain-containing protein
MRMINHRQERRTTRPGNLTRRGAKPAAQASATRRIAAAVSFEPLEPRALMSAVTLAPASLSAKINSATSLTLSWTNKAANATGYNILVSTAGSAFAPAATISSAKTTTKAFTGLNPDTAYSYEIEAVGGGITSAPTRPITFTTAPPAPTALTVASTDRTTVTLNWTDGDSAATGYYVLRSTNGKTYTTLTKLAGPTAATFTDTTVTSGHTYDYEVEAYNASATSAASNAVIANTPLAAPSGLNANGNGPKTVQLAWTNNDPDAIGYYVLRSLEGNVFTKVGTVTRATTPIYVDTTAAPNTSYFYEVEAFAGSIVSPASASATATTLMAPPSGLSAAAAPNMGVTLKWTDNDPSATGYTLLLSTDGGKTFNTQASITGGTTKTYLDTLTAGGAYSYRIEAVDGTLVSAVSNTATLTMAPLAPTGLTATVQSATMIALNWTDNDPNGTGYNVLRTTDGKTFTVLKALAGSTADTYTDATTMSGKAYGYEIQAIVGSAKSVVSNEAIVVTPLAAPTLSAAVAVSPTSVKLTWVNNDKDATGFLVLRSTDGQTFTPYVAVTSVKTLTFTDTHATSGTTYYYEIEATAGAIVSAASAAQTVTTPMLAPSGLTATLSGSTVTLTWADHDASATGYNILRCTDGLSYAQYDTVTSGTGTTYSDTTVTPGTTYYYEVQAFNTNNMSVVSNGAHVAVPQGNPNGVSIITRYGSELAVTAAGADDAVSVTESGSTLSITADGVTSTDPAPADGLFIYTRGGADSISIDASVTEATTIDSIDGAVTTITSAGSAVSVWDDSTDIFTGTATVHSVNTFAGGVSKVVGAALPNPIDAGTTTAVQLSLWGAGPTADDVNQGQVGDCYFLSTLAAFAGQRPAQLQQDAVDMGDGTYVVEFHNGTTPVYVRVSDQLSVNASLTNWLYAHPGSADTIWAPVMEKAFAYFRHGANTYASINSGWMGEVDSDLGVSNTALFFGGDSESALYTLLSNDLANNDPVTMGTLASGSPDLVNSHAYTLIAVTQDPDGTTHYTVRNPWGIKGDAVEDANGYATLTYAQFEANFVDGCAATS